MPIGNILIGNATSDIKHDNAALAVNIISIAEASKLFLSSCIPNVKFDGATVGVEQERMNFNSNSS